jgi:glutaredoxin
MDDAGLEYRAVNIWDEPDAASTVRDYARGNETVPTVVIGEPGSADAVGLVNPALAEVLDVLGRRG